MKAMKNQYIRKFYAAILCSGLALTAPSCSEKLLDIKPTTEEPAEFVFENAANVEAALLSAYNAMMTNVGQNSIRTSELYGDNIDFSNNTNNDDREFFTRIFDIFNAIGGGTGASNGTGGLWGTGYRAIYRANTVLKIAQENPPIDATAAQIARWKGEALFIRAACHFDLVRLFALPYTSNPTVNPGVVIRDIPATPEQAKAPKGRARISEVYDFVIRDLNQVINENLLPITSGGNGRATVWAAKALLARVYFSMDTPQGYQKAFELTDDIIKNGGFTLTNPVSPRAKVRQPFGNSGGTGSPVTGIIFQCTNTGGNDFSTNLRNNYYNNSLLGNTAMPLDTTNSVSQTSIYKLLQQRGGLRFDSLTRNVNAQGAFVRPVVTKFFGIAPVNVPIIRLAEIYLTRAEARVQVGGFNDADVRADYNVIRELAGVAADNSTSGKDALLEQIRTERRLELFMEGDRYHELRRLKSTNIRGISYDDKSGLLKIPTGETGPNPNLEQN